MAARVKVWWDTCEVDGCIGILLEGTSSCWTHASEEEVSAALEHVTQTGQLDARGVTLGEGLLERLLAAAPRDAEGRTCLSDANFAGATSARLVSFDRIIFTGHTRFGAATFTGGASFEGTDCQHGARFDGTDFQRDTSFKGATFEGDAWFDGASFAGPVAFGRATFQASAQFSEARFTVGARFDGATVRGEARFDGAAFVGGSRFDEAAFEGRARFRGRGSNVVRSSAWASAVRRRSRRARSSTRPDSTVPPS